MTRFYRPQYYADVEAGVAYLAREASARVALRWVEALEKTLARLDSQPGLGRRRTDLTPPGVRSLSVDDFPRYLLFYIWHQDQEAIEIIRVRHGMMNLPLLMPPQ
jgi:plasmid stabilization system protein ParE